MSKPLSPDLIIGPVLLQQITILAILAMPKV